MTTPILFVAACPRHRLFAVFHRQDSISQRQRILHRQILQRAGAFLANIIIMGRLTPHDTAKRHIAVKTPADIEASRGAKANEALFKELVRGTEIRVAEIDRRLRPLLAEGWKLERLEILLRCILRLGAFELITRYKVPAVVVIKEYVDLADAFFSTGEPGVVNGILDRIAREVRPGELEAHHGGSADPAG